VEPQDRVLGAGLADVRRLLLGRARLGWRGRKAVRVLYLGSGLLLLGYAGSRFVLEVILSARMKYLLVMAAGAGGVLVWRTSATPKETPPHRARRPRRNAAAVTEMVACDVCARAPAAIRGPDRQHGGIYCSDTHRRQAGS
jgi:hypothetical protein